MTAAAAARSVGCELIAEGIETEPERSVLTSLEVQLGQGYLLGRPAPIDEVQVSSTGG